MAFNFTARALKGIFTERALKGTIIQEALKVTFYVQWRCEWGGGGGGLHRGLQRQKF